MPRISRVQLACLLVLVSGACALVYQLAWMRQFRLIFGGMTSANAAVLAIFMGGLGVGNLLLGRRFDKSRNPLRAYALLELTIAVSAAASPWLLVLVRHLYIACGGQQSLGVAGASAMRLLLAAPVLAIPTIAMGGTLPAVSSFAVSVNDERRRALGLVYGFNTLGAVIGVAVCTFLMLESFGTQSTLQLTCAVNAGLALVAWMASRRYVEATSGPATEPRDSTSTPAALSTPLTCLASALTGFAFFVMEPAWYRLLSPLLGGSTYTFGLILAVALSGIGIGGLLYPMVVRRVRPSTKVLAVSCGLEAFFLAIPFSLGDRLAVLALSLRERSDGNFFGLILGWMLVTAIVVFPASVVSGAQFPLLVALLGEGRLAVGRQVGLVFACNTLGAIVGALTGGFLLLPLLTAPGCWRGVVMVLAGLSATLAVMASRRSRSWKPLVAPLALAGLAIGLMQADGPTSAWRHSGIGAGRASDAHLSSDELHDALDKFDDQLVWEAEGREASVALMKNDEGLYFCINGKSDGHAVGDAGTQIMLGLVGALRHPQPTNALVIGLGSGESAGWLSEVEAVKHVDVVEIEPVVRQVAAWCADGNSNVLADTDVNIAFNDAREYLLTSRGVYDLIVSEPSNPYRAGVCNLFTSEFYEAVNDSLAPNGVFVQWLQCYDIDSATVAMVLETLRGRFPHVEIWTGDASDLLLVCARDGRQLVTAGLRDRIAHPPFAECVYHGWRARHVESVLAHYLGGPATVEAVCRAAPASPVTDDRNRLEYSMARLVGQGQPWDTNQFRRQAIAIDDWKIQGVEEIDWELVQDQWCYSNGIPPGGANNRSRQLRVAALTAFPKSPDRVVQLWGQQSRSPKLFDEVITLAQSYAILGREEALPLIADIRAVDPVTADFLAAVQQAVRGHEAAAIEPLESSFEKLQHYPWASQPVVDSGLLLTLLLARQPGADTARLREMIDQPFSLYVKEETRQNILQSLPGGIGD